MKTYTDDDYLLASRTLPGDPLASQISDLATHFAAMRSGGAGDERARIVAWLRYRGGNNYQVSALISGIETGEHETWRR